MQIDLNKVTEEKITWVHPWVPGKLFSFRTTRFKGFRFKPGQFARLGIVRTDTDGKPYLVWRAYSIVSANYDEFLEFFSIVVPDGEFTSQLSQLKPGDSIYIEKTNYGFLTTDRFSGGKYLWMLSSGTGLAPFISMLWDLKNWEDYERIIVVHSVRETNELAYRDTILAFKTNEYFSEFFTENPNKLLYIPVVTRENTTGMLHQRIPQLIEDGTLESVAGLALEPINSRILLCGNPIMVEDLRKTLKIKDFTTSRREKPGQIAVENYW